MRNPFSRARRLGWLLPMAVLAVGACDDVRNTVLDAVGDPAFDFDMSADARGIPGGTVTRTIAAADSTVRLTLRPVPGALASGVYQFWGVNRNATGNDVATALVGRVVEFFRRDSLDAGGLPVIDPITGEDTIRVIDSTVVSASIGTYAGSNSPFVDSVRVWLSNQDPGNAVNPYLQNAVVLSIEGAAATTPSAAKFLWRRIGVGGNGALSFGNFGGTDLISTVSPNDYLFGVAGSGLGAIRGPEVSVDFQQLSRPPVGFYYRMYLVGDPGDRATFLDTLMVDTLRSAYSPVPTESRVSLYDADISQLLPGVSPTSVSRSQIRNCVAGSGTNNCQNTLQPGGSAEQPFDVYREVWLMLAPKGSAVAMGRTRIFLGAVPAEAQ